MATTFYHSVGPGFHGLAIDASGSSIKLGNFSMKFLPRHLGRNPSLFGQNEFNISSQQKFHSIHGAVSYSGDKSQDSSSE